MGTLAVIWIIWSRETQFGVSSTFIVKGEILLISVYFRQQVVISFLTRNKSVFTWGLTVFLWISQLNGSYFLKAYLKLLLKGFTTVFVSCISQWKENFFKDYVLPGCKKTQQLFMDPAVTHKHPLGKALPFLWVFRRFRPFS